MNPFLASAIVWDIETYSNVFTFTARTFYGAHIQTWVISKYRNDAKSLHEFLNWCRVNKIPMIGFNNVKFDHAVIHHWFADPSMSAEEIYAYAQRVISDDKTLQRIWPDNRLAPQIDLYLLNHFDNKNKATSLKALQIAMRMENVVDAPYHHSQFLTESQMQEVIGYNQHDVNSTLMFGHLCMEAIEFRISMIPQLGLDVLNFNDTKIGEKLVEKRLPESLCYERDPLTGKRKRRATFRNHLNVKDLIFPYIAHDNPSFQKVRKYFETKILLPFEWETHGDAPLETKGVFSKFNDQQEKLLRKVRKDPLTPEEQLIIAPIFKYCSLTNAECAVLFKICTGHVIREKDEKSILSAFLSKSSVVAPVGGLDFYFGVGGLHASIESQKVVPAADEAIRDIDVSGMYPRIIIVNNLYPEHMGEMFASVYALLPKERKEWQKKKGKKCAEANALKLGGNGVFGKSNSIHSVFYDPKMPMSVTINGQLMLAMLIEKLVEVPSLQIIQANTDGVTYKVNKRHLDEAKQLEKAWEVITNLNLEDVEYSRMFIRDVNNYVGEYKDGSLKLKGAYWSPDANRYFESISESQPPAWYKDFSSVVIQRAAVAHMTKGIPVKDFIYSCRDPYDFMIRVRAKGSGKLFHGQQSKQKNLRVHIANTGEPIRKVIPCDPSMLGKPKRAVNVSEKDYLRVMKANNWQWQDSVCTKNKSVYEDSVTLLLNGLPLVDCSSAANFDWTNLNYAWYISEAEKLIL